MTDWLTIMTMASGSMMLLMSPNWWGFKSYHAMVFVAKTDEQWLESEEALSRLENYYKNMSITNLHIEHITFLDENSEDYQLQWREMRANTSLASFSRFFWCVLLKIQAIAIASLPDFYSTFYSDCLEYCKTFAKNFERLKFLVLDRWWIGLMH